MKKAIENIKIWIRTRPERRAERKLYKSAQSLYGSWAMDPDYGGAVDSGAIRRAA